MARKRASDRLPRSKYSASVVLPPLSFGGYFHKYRPDHRIGRTKYVRSYVPLGSLADETCIFPTVPHLAARLSRLSMTRGNGGVEDIPLHAPRNAAGWDVRS